MTGTRKLGSNSTVEGIAIVLKPLLLMLIPA